MADSTPKKKIRPCQNGICIREAEPGSKFCAKHANANPNQFPWLGCGGALVVVVLIGWFIFNAVTGGDDTPGTSSGSGGSSNSALASDASTYLRSNFTGDPAYALVSSVDVKSGVLWMYTTIPAGDTASAVAACGLGSAWVYGDSDATAAGLWGVSVRASDGQRLIQRDGFSDSCS